ECTGSCTNDIRTPAYDPYEIRSTIRQVNRQQIKLSLFFSYLFIIKKTSCASHSYIHLSWTCVMAMHRLQRLFFMSHCTIQVKAVNFLTMAFAWKTCQSRLMLIQKKALLPGSPPNLF